MRHAVSAHPRHADRGGDRARRRGNLHRQVRPHQGAVPLGPPGQEGRQELVLGARGAELGGAQLRHLVSAAHRPGGGGHVPGGRSRPAAGGGVGLQRRADGAVRAAGQQDAERAAHAFVDGRQCGELQRVPLRGQEGLRAGPAACREGPDDRGGARRVALGGARRDHHGGPRPHRAREARRDDHHRQRPHRDGARERDDHRRSRTAPRRCT